MKEFTGHIRVTAINLTSTTISGAGTFDFLADPFDFQPVASDDSGGLSYNCDKTFVIDTPDAETLRTFSVPRQALVELYGSDGSRYVIGTAAIPARVLISSHLQRSQLQMHCTMLRNPLL